MLAVALRPGAAHRADREKVSTLAKPLRLKDIHSAGDFAAWLFHFCGSLRLTVVLLLYIAVACVYGTFFEGRHGTKAAQAFVYKSWWFDIGLGLMATNITCSTLRRFPFQGKHTGFIVTHIGILVILFGAFLTHRYGIEGQVAILEGESEARLFHEENILTVSPTPDEIAASFATDFEYEPWNHAPGETFEAESLGLRLTVEEYYPEAEKLASVSDDGAVDNPAVLVGLHGGRMTGNTTSEHWLVARDPERNVLDFGMMTISLEEKASAAAVQAVLDALGDSAPQAPPSRGKGVLAFKSAAFTVPPDFSIEVEKSMGQTIPIGDSGVFVRLVRYFPAFVIEKDEQGKMIPTNKTDEPINPAIEFEVGRGETVVDRRYKFLHYEFDIKPPEIPLEVAWEAPELSAAASAHGHDPEAKALRLFVLPGGEVHYVSTVSGEPRSGVLAPGGSVELSSRAGLSAQLVSVARRARLVDGFVNKGNEVKNPAVKVRVQGDGAEASTWVRSQSVSPVRVGKKTYFVGYGSRSTTLPFRLHLVDFKEKQYPKGLRTAAMSSEFSSRVILEDPERGVMREHTISMNNVLDWRGYRFFQSSFSRQPGAEPDSVRETSVFAVNKDPGKTTVYIGFTVLVAGIVLLFYVQPALRKKRAVRPAPKGPAPAAPVHPHAEVEAKEVRIS